MVCFHVHSYTPVPLTFQSHTVPYTVHSTQVSLVCCVTADSGLCIAAALSQTEYIVLASSSLEELNVQCCFFLSSLCVCGRRPLFARLRRSSFSLFNLSLQKAPGHEILQYCSVQCGESAYRGSEYLLQMGFLLNELKFGS